MVVAGRACCGAGLGAAAVGRVGARAAERWRGILRVDVSCERVFEKGQEFLEIVQVRWQRVFRDEKWKLGEWMEIRQGPGLVAIL